MEYSENTWDEFGVEHRWKHTKCLDRFITSRGTLIEMIHRPNWGIACYMDNAIQSCEVDESFYHESLVHPVLSTASVYDRVMIIGGGEGATAREVLKWPVKKVDMFEWDKDVVDLFKTRYPQWAKEAWKDIRLKVHYDDIFTIIKTPPQTPYDIIIIDLFDPDESNMAQWDILLTYCTNWLQPHGSIVLYSGIRNILDNKQSYEVLAKKVSRAFPLLKITPYKVFIPSFSGESTFLLATHPMTNPIYSVPSHITSDIWKSYTVFNY